MTNHSTIPSQLSPIDTMPSLLGPAEGLAPQRRPAKASPWPRVGLIAIAGALLVYLLGQFGGL